MINSKNYGSNNNFHGNQFVSKTNYFYVHFGYSFTNASLVIQKANRTMSTDVRVFMALCEFKYTCRFYYRNYCLTTIKPFINC